MTTSDWALFAHLLGQVSESLLRTATQPVGRVSNPTTIRIGFDALRGDIPHKIRDFIEANDLDLDFTNSTSLVIENGTKIRISILYGPSRDRYVRRM